MNQLKKEMEADLASAINAGKALDSLYQKRIEKHYGPISVKWTEAELRRLDQVIARKKNESIH